MIPTDPDMPPSSTNDKRCQNCNHGEWQHDVLDRAYYKCRICGMLCSGKFYQIEADD